MFKNRLLRIPAILLAFLAGQSLVAQQGIDNRDTFFISNNQDTLFIGGSLSNSSTAYWVNNGNVYLKKDMINNQENMAIGTGCLYLTGSSRQVLGGSAGFRTYNLFSGNAAGIGLNNGLEVNGLHVFSAGIIDATTPEHALQYTETSNWTGASDESHVNGWVKKRGQSDFSFPVGNGSYLRPVTLTQLAAADNFAVRHFETTPFSTNIAAPLMLVDIHEYWNIVAAANTNAIITLNWNNHKIDFPGFLLPQVRVASHSGSLWSNQGGSATGDELSIGQITSTQAASSGMYTFASTSWFLPIHLLDFTGKLVAENAALNWQVSPDAALTYFEVERSEDGRQFKVIGKVNAGTSASYQYLDPFPPSGKAWYRIHCFDKNGQERYSKQILLSRTLEGDFYVINNPVYQYIYLYSAVGRAGKYEYSLFNAGGQLVQKGGLTVTAGSVSSISIGSTIAEGIYVLDIRNAAHRYTRRLVIRR